MSRTEHQDARHLWHPNFDGPHFAPLDDQCRDRATESAPVRMPTLGAFVLTGSVVKIKAALLPWVCVFRPHDYPDGLSPTRCRRCGRSSACDQGD